MVGGDANLDDPVPDGDAGCKLCKLSLGDPGGIVVEARLGSATPVRFHLWTYPSASADRKPICLLSINDFHMHFEPWGPSRRPLGGLARVASMLKAMRAANDEAGIPTVVFNSGDDFENTLFHDEPGAFEALMETWDRVGVDFWQVGNHDYHFGIPFLADRIVSVSNGFSDLAKGHPMTITWGNADPSTLTDDVISYAELFETGFNDPDDLKLFQQTVVLDTGDVMVGVLGVVTDAAVYTQVPGDPMFLRLLGAASPDAQGLTFMDPDPRESDYIGDAVDALLEQGADLIVANSHAGLGFGDRANIPPGKDEHIARHGIGHDSGRPVDVIISGHSHIKLNRAIFLDNPAGGRTGIMQALEGGMFVARADLVVDVDTDTVDWVDSRLVQVDATTGHDTYTAAMVEQFAATLDSRYPGRLDGVAEFETFLSSRERSFSGMGRLINAAFLNSLPPDGGEYVSFVVPSTYRTDIHPGPIGLDLSYQVLSMHKMDDRGTNMDTIATISLRPGRFDMSMAGLDDTVIEGVTAIEYMLELVHSVQDVLGDIMPGGASELNLDIVQLGGVSYVLDATAPPFSRVVEGSVMVGASAVDPDTVYRIAGPHSIVMTFASMLDSFIVASDPDTGVDVGSMALADPDTGQPFTDTGIDLWRSLHEFLDKGMESDVVPTELLLVDGRHFRTLQPDLTLNPSDITLDPPIAKPGDQVTISVRVRNLGEAPVDSARIGLYYEKTPWDLADDPDGFEHMQDLPADHEGSRAQIGETLIGVPEWPGATDVTFSWTVPDLLPVGAYPVEVRIEDVYSDGLDPNTGEPYLEFTETNNSGRQRSRLLEVE